MSIVCDLMGHCSAQRGVKLNSVCLSRTRLLFGEISDSYSDCRTPVIDPASYRLIQLSITLVIESTTIHTSEA